MKNWKKHEGSMPTLTKEDKIVCEALSLYARSETYIARDKTNLLLVYFSKPVKSEEDEWWSNEDMRSLVIEDKFFKFITWDDEEPWLLDDLLKLEVEENEQKKTITRWIPFTLDESGCLNCPYPDDGEDILISDGRTVWMDNFNDNDDGCFLYHSFRKLKDFEGLAWAKLPKPHKKEIKNENVK